MDDAPSEIADLDDFQVIAERRQAAETIAALTDRYRKLSQVTSHERCLPVLRPRSQPFYTTTGRTWWLSADPCGGVHEVRAAPRMS